MLSKVEKIIRRVWADIRHAKVAIAFFVIYCALTNLLFHAYCPFKLLTGIPCPGCGLTRAGLSLLTLHFKKAWYYHPMIFLIVPELMALMLWRYVLCKRPKHLKAVAIVTLFGLLILYPVRMRMFFPDRCGMEFYEDNLTGLIVPYWNACIQHFIKNI